MKFKNIKVGKFFAIISDRMKPKNKYLAETDISTQKFKQILREFCRDNTTSETSDRVNISHTTINEIYRALRTRIYILTLRNNKAKIRKSLYKILLKELRRYPLKLVLKESK